MATNSISPIDMLRLLLHWGEEPMPTLDGDQMAQLHAHVSMAGMLGRDYWREQIAARTKEEAARLIRGIVRAEEAKVLHGGSVSLSIHAFKAYAQRWPGASSDLAEWVMRNSGNDYAPFGTYRYQARSLAELSERNADRAARRAAIRRAEEKRAEEGALRRASARTAHVVRTALQGERKSERNARILELAMLPPVARIKTLVGNLDVPISYYPMDLVETCLPTVREKDPVLLDMLKDYIAQSKDRKWLKWSRTHLG
jgi:hypothetical protein